MNIIRDVVIDVCNAVFSIFASIVIKGKILDQIMEII
jgi:hypothetical protein